MQIDFKALQDLPVINYVRMTYATIVLTKLYFSATSATSEIGKFLDQESLQVSQYLDKLVLHLMKAIRFRKNRVASKFLMILTALRQWFSLQRMRVHPNPNQREQIEPCFFIKPSESPVGEISLSSQPDNWHQKEEKLFREGIIHQPAASNCKTNISSPQPLLSLTQSWESTPENHTAQATATVGVDQPYFHDINSDLLSVPISSSGSLLNVPLEQIPNFNDVDMFNEDINDWIMSEKIFDDINTTQFPGILNLD